MKYYCKISAMELAIILLMLVKIVGCSQEKNSEKHSSDIVKPVKKQVAEITAPNHSDIFRCGDSIRVRFNIRERTAHLDSVVIKAGINSTVTYSGDYSSVYWVTDGARVGQNIIKATFHYNDSMKENHSVAITLLSDVIPRSYKYRVVQTYPHDEEAFTQGLIYHDGYLLESTGQNRKSSLRKVKISTGEIVQIVNLDPGFFGEGLTILRDKIYQLTWKKQTGFVYDLNNLGLLKTFNFTNEEGWGLTSTDDNLVMTDGSSFLYIIEPEYFTQIEQIDVFNHKGRITQLNELEYVNGKILANVLGETFILVIDPLSGKVTGEIELKALVPKELDGDMHKVLNGIAYNEETGNLFVTGKYWPLLYEIEIEGGI
ncbi:MAG: glutaminyl-peptide cyclotransferase [Bacteroidales bacterium]|nr:glutaminyl-peptide cyclotransferase [Bacteroidales bacterium]